MTPNFHFGPLVAAMKRFGFQMATAGAIGTIGDALQQTLEGQRELDGERCTRIAAFRSCQAPFVDIAWTALDRWFRAVPGAPGIALKVLVDQCVLMPVSVASFFACMGAMEGLDARACAERARRGFVPAVSCAVPFWSCAHVITFGVVPPLWRVTWTSTVAVVWSAFMSRANQQAAGKLKMPVDEDQLGLGSPSSLEGTSTEPARCPGSIPS